MRAQTHQIGRQGRQSVVLAFCPPILDRHVATFDKTGLIQALMECGQEARESFPRSTVEEPDHWHSRLLRPRAYRPRGCRAAEPRDERAPPHSLTSLPPQRPTSTPRTPGRPTA